MFECVNVVGCPDGLRNGPNFYVQWYDLCRLSNNKFVTYCTYSLQYSRIIYFLCRQL